ncbi:MAG: PRC-barrel domain-containing protein [Paracoccaceae bacterium]|jgi:hypothetical protein
MKRLSLLIANTAFAASFGLAAAGFAETTKVMLTKVGPIVLTTAWRATDIFGALVYDDSGVEIGKVKDMLVTADGSIPFVIVTNIVGSDEAARSVVVAASDF